MNVFAQFNHSPHPGARQPIAAKCCYALVLAWGLSSLLVSAAPLARPGQVQYSNGDILEGKISLSPGAELKIHEANQLRTLAFDRVREIRFKPIQEQMVQKWRFLEAGQTKKEFSGKPYLTRSLQATVYLAGGEKVIGHLYTTVFYVEGEEKTQKVIVLEKQRGKEGEGADALKYPSLISFADTAGAAEDTIRVRLTHPGLTEKTELAAQTWGALLTLNGRKAGQSGEFILPSPLGMDVFVALKTGASIVVGWPKAADPKLVSLIQTNLTIAEDFFDDRKLLGVYYDKPNSDIYTLLMLGRKGRTTMDGDKTQPWRLVILRWKYDEETNRVLLAGRGSFFRGILAKGGAPPTVTLAPELWKLKKTGDVWTTGQ